MSARECVHETGPFDCGRSRVRSIRPGQTILTVTPSRRDASREFRPFLPTAAAIWWAGALATAARFFVSMGSSPR